MMLILKRKAGEAIDVGDNVRIVLKEISGGHVKIGVEAPTNIRVRRSETRVTIREENLRAARSLVPSGDDLSCLDDLTRARADSVDEGDHTVPGATDA
jgi:carbon storage regulator